MTYEVSEKMPGHNSIIEVGNLFANKRTKDYNSKR